MAKPIYSGQATAPKEAMEDLDKFDGILCLGGPRKKKYISDGGEQLYCWRDGEGRGHIYLRYRIEISADKEGLKVFRDFMVYDGIEGQRELHPLEKAQQ